VGICQGDLASVADTVNAAQERLITCREAGETGWFGSWARTVFNVSRSNPYITLPREIARIVMADVCRHPIAIQNDFYQFLEFGIGLQNPTCCGFDPNGLCGGAQMFRVGNFPTMVDIATPNQTVQVFLTDPSDVGKTVVISGLDKNGAVIYSQSGLTPVVGETLTLASPFVQFPLELSQISGIQKDITTGYVKFYQTDLTTGAQVLLLSMAPSETVADYPRYQITNLPANCCHTITPGTVQITAMAKLEFIPAQVDSDFLMFHSPGGLEALIAECQVTRFESMDSESSDKKSAWKHRQAIGFLQGQLSHMLGQNRPAVIFAPFGSARLARQRIGTLT
jgi:hypothetical protein